MYAPVCWQKGVQEFLELLWRSVCIYYYMFITYTESVYYLCIKGFEFYRIYVIYNVLYSLRDPGHVMRRT